ncbi:MAG: DUF61 family protein [Deltaproteobacteria bacterium]|nr:DUF61 family protein [Deltaproteobacteria bacterium]
MPTDRTIDSVMLKYLGNEFRTVNAQLPRIRKTLNELLKETQPFVLLHDGGRHFFRRRELDYLAEIISSDECSTLMLPIIFEVGSGRMEVIVRSQDPTQAKVFAAILDIPVDSKGGMIRISRIQLSILRKKLQTTTLYVFVP